MKYSMQPDLSSHGIAPALLAMACSVILCTSTTLEVAAFDLAVDGNPATMIVIPDDPFPVERFAAEELRHHVRKASGAELVIIEEGELSDDSPNGIYIGRSAAMRAVGFDPDALKADSFRSWLTEDGLYFFGDDSDGDPLSDYTNGTLFGVYDFLENHMGVRWVWPGELGEMVPEQATIRVEHWDRTGSPRMGVTTWRIIPQDELWPDPQAGKAFFHAQAQWKKRMGFTITHDFRPSHNFPDYWERFGQSNPGFFNLLPNGKRTPLLGDPAGGFVTLCVSEPTLWEQIIRDWEDDGRPAVLKVGENDTPGLCTCERCRAWDAPDWRFYTSPYWAQGRVPTRFTRFAAESGVAGDSAAWGGVFRPDNGPSLSDRYARFYAKVYQLASEIDPGVTVAGYGYSNYWRAPQQTQLHEGILISYVPPLWYPYTARMSREARKQWDGWRDTGAKVMFRPNLTHAGHAFPIQYDRALIEDIQYFNETGSVGMHFDLMIGSWATQGPTYYALGRAVHRPDLSPEQILDEYYSAFGPAASAVEDYFDHWRDVSDRLDEDQISLFYYESSGGGSYRNWVLIADRIFIPEVMTEGRRRLAVAREAARGHEQATARIDFLDKGLTHVERVLDVLQAHKTKPVDEARLTQVLSRLYDYRRQIQWSGVADMGYLVLREPGSWRRDKAESSAD